jgi:preprotein translocase subunit SecF
MEFFKQNTHIPFMKQRASAAIVSIVICLASILSLAIHGLNLGLDFTGGTQFEMNFKQPPDITNVREQMAQAGFPEAVVQPYGTTHDILIRVGIHKEYSQQQLRDKVLTLFPNATIQQMEFIGPQVGKTLVTNGILAVLVSLLGIMVYIAMRFEYRFAVSAAVAIIHDPIVILGIFSFLGIEFNLIGLAAVLTVIGYSINDTIVVYDRIRENFRKLRKGSTSEIIDNSINQTLSRTIMTSGLTAIVVISLLIFGGEVLHGFSLALLIGIVVGTYSSIYIAGSLALALGLERQHLLPPARKELDDRP